MAERKKTTVYIDADLLTAAKVRAARSGKREYEVFEDALRESLGFQESLERMRKLGEPMELDADEALELAREELEAARQEQDLRKAG